MDSALLHRPKIVYSISLPRTGSTLVKRYLGENENLVPGPFADFEKAFQRSLDLLKGHILIDKATRNIDHLDAIFDICGVQGWFLAVIRDPRDQLVSLCETDRHPEIPRDQSFWPYWTQRYSRLLERYPLFSRRGSGVMLLRYEDLVVNPVALKGVFCHWLGIVPTHLSTAYTTDPNIASERDPSEDWKAHLAGHVHAQSVGRWRSVNGRTREVIEAYRGFHDARIWMRRFGYFGSGEFQSENIGSIPILLSSDSFTGRVCPGEFQ